MVQCGDALQRVAPEVHGRGRTAGPPSHLQEVFQLRHPILEQGPTYEAITGSLQNTFVLQVRATAGLWQGRSQCMLSVWGWCSA